MAKRTKKHLKIWLALALSAALLVASWWYFGKYPVPVLQPSGDIGDKQKHLIILCTLLSVIVVVPVFTLLIFFAHRYRESNHTARYDPDLDGNAKAETIWWLVPAALIAVISVITWRSSYALDPYKQLESSKPTLKVQVVSLDWKWLFIYPEQGVASVNFAPIPVDRPVEFQITSDTVMTSFWVPSLGSQMYAMPGMVTKLNLNATKVGEYNGSAANISGEHFADMTFKVAAFGDGAFNSWARALKNNDSPELDTATYKLLAKPGIQKGTELSRFSTVDQDLYDTIVMKYMMPMGNEQTKTTPTVHEVHE